MDGVLAFRNAMAEQGTEYTPAKAAEVMDATESFRKCIHDGARENPENYEELKNLTRDQKQRICNEFREVGQEVSLNELDRLIQLVLDTYEQEKLF